MSRLPLFAALAACVLAGTLALRCLTQPELADSIRWRLGLPAAESSPFYRQMRGHLRRQAANSGSGRVIFLGDSITQGMDCTTLSTKALNLGIGGDTTAGLLRRLTDYPDLGYAEAIVLLVGINDCPFRDNAGVLANYRQILDALPPGPRLFVVEVLPIDQRMTGGCRSTAGLAALNSSLRALCSGRCEFVPTWNALADPQGKLRAEYHEGDGIHLNEAGYRVLKELLKTRLQAPRLQ